MTQDDCKFCSSTSLVLKMDVFGTSKTEIANSNLGQACIDRTDAHQDPPVGQQHGCASHPEQAVWNQHGALVAEVPVLGDVLSANYQSPAVWVHLHKVIRKHSHPSLARHANLVRVKYWQEHKQLNRDGDKPLSFSSIYS